MAGGEERRRWVRFPVHGDALIVSEGLHVAADVRVLSVGGAYVLVPPRAQIGRRVRLLLLSERAGGGADVTGHVLYETETHRGRGIALEFACSERRPAGGRILQWAREHLVGSRRGR